MHKMIQTKATCKIGMLYYRNGDFVSAEKYFTSYFEMARELEDVKILDSARVNLGIVRTAIAVLWATNAPTCPTHHDALYLPMTRMI